MPRTAVPLSLQVAFSRDYIQSTTGDLDEEYLWRSRRGRYWLRQAGLDARSADLAFLAYVLHFNLTVEQREAESLDSSYFVVGDLTDQVSDEEAALLCEIEPELKAAVPREGVGGMTPEVTALHELLLEVAATIEEAWAEREDD